MTFVLGFIVGVGVTLVVLAGWAMLALASECERFTVGDDY